MALQAPVTVRLSEVIASLSYALDLTEGQPAGHSARSALIGMRLGERLGLDAAARSDLLYASLLKDAGCSANAARVAELYGADDRGVKRDRKRLDQHRPAELARHLVSAPAAGRGPVAKAGRIAALVRTGSEGSRALIRMRCERGAEIARMVDVSEAAAEAIYTLDEHWDGSGGPDGLAGERIPLLGRILCLAQTVEAFHGLNGPSYACAMARSRAGTWFEPALVDELSAFEEDDAFWARLEADPDPDQLVARLEPRDRVLHADDDGLDRIAAAFAQIIDAKSPFTAEHSEGVRDLAVGIAEHLGYPPEGLRDLRRAALLHDVGKLGVSNRILDKPTALRPDEWAQVKRHPAHTLRILARVPAFSGVALIAAAHHEKLDGSGYHLGLTAEDLPLAARILAVADMGDALSAWRPYRGPLAPEEVVAIMTREVPHRLDPAVFSALRGHLRV